MAVQEQIPLSVMGGCALCRGSRSCDYMFSMYRSAIVGYPEADTGSDGRQGAEVHSDALCETAKASRLTSFLSTGILPAPISDRYVLQPSYCSDLHFNDSKHLDGSHHPMIRIDY